MEYSRLATLVTLQTVRQWLLICSDRIVRKRTIQNTISEMERILEEYELEEGIVAEFEDDPEE